MKAILVAVSPEICKDILNGNSHSITLKSCPKLALPFKVYLYCNKGRNPLKMPHANCNTYELHAQNGSYYTSDYTGINSTIVAEFKCEEMYKHAFIDATILNPKPEYTYEFTISDLIKYQHTRSLSTLHKPCTDKYRYCDGCKHVFIQYPDWVETSEDLKGCSYDTVCLNFITTPPKSWCYVED